MKKLLFGCRRPRESKKDNHIYCGKITVKQISNKRVKEIFGVKGRKIKPVRMIFIKNEVWDEWDKMVGKKKKKSFWDVFLK